MPRVRWVGMLALVIAAAACGDDPVAVPDVIGPCHPLYGEDVLPTFALELRPADWQALQADYAARVKGTYYPAQLRVDGELVPDVRVRLRGRAANWVGAKLQLQIAFNRVDKGRRFRGLRRLSLDASPWDQSLLRERVALSALRDMGLPAPCANNARLVVNGAYLGLYGNVEHADRELLERVFAYPGGDLFSIDGATGAWELETNEDASDLARLARYLATTDVDALASLADLEGSVAEWAGEAMVPHAEGYWAGAINFLLYDHPQRGFVTMPYDLDSAFFFDDVAGSGLDRLDPETYVFPGATRPAQAAAVLADPTWAACYRDELDRAHAAYDVAALQGRTTRWARQIADAVDADPNRAFTMDEHAAAVQQIRDFVAARAAFVAAR